jgi:hypothetical protein
MMLSKRQFAAAVGATEKWVDNASRILARRFSRTETEARWLGLVRTISRAFDMSLQRAGELATEALHFDPHSPPSTIGLSGDGALAIVIDVQRYHSWFSLALAAALLDARYHKGPRPPQFPRRARTRAAILMVASASGVNMSRLHGLAIASPAARMSTLGEPVLRILCDLARAHIPHVLIGDVAAVARGAPRDEPRLEVCYGPDMTVATRLTALLVDWKAQPLRVSDDFPFVPELQTVADAPVLALATRHGDVVLRKAADFASMAENADMFDLGTGHTLVLRVEALVEALRTSRHPLPATAIPELEAAAVAISRIHFKP